MEAKLSPAQAKGILGVLRGIISDPSGSPSSKRVIVMAFSILVGVGYFADLFYGMTVDKTMVDAIMYIIIAGLGITGAEKFAPAAPAE